MEHNTPAQPPCDGIPPPRGKGAETSGKETRPALARGSLPLIGHSLQLMTGPLKFVTSLAAYGDIVEIRLGPLPVYVITRPDLVRSMLLDAHNFERGRLFAKLRSFLGHGLLTSPAPVHRRDRLFLQPVFNSEQIHRSATVMRGTAQSLSESWRPGQIVRIDRAMYGLAMSTLARTLITKGFEPHNVGRLERDIPTLVRGGMARTVLPDWWTKLPTLGNTRFQRARRSVDATVSEIMTAYDGSADECDDLMSRLLALRDDDGNGLSLTQIRDHLVTFAIAGVETTGTMLAWVFHELGRHPQARELLHAELDAVLHGRPPEFEDLARLEYTNRVVNEVLRLHHGWIEIRRAKNTVRLGNVEVPAGRDIAYSPYGMQRDPRWFPDPESFEPDRWLPERAESIPQGAFIPFSVGARKCIGDRFAVAEMILTIAVICRRWKLNPVPGVRVREIPRAVAHPSRLPMVAELRLPA
ncbi:cytochrome P450 [Streptomyces sp. NPDC026294]|uniref:cytochrome P450 n=1 Tax=Streptomyces sp. NPDC026294 TaxID=3155362 RepID=UPI0033E9B088